MRHFVWQADAWLHGRFAISWPVSSGPLPNDFYLDVVPVPGQPGFGRTPYRPLPAIVILPAVAVFGLGTDAELVGAIIGAINAGLAWLIARQLATRPSVALAATLFFSFGTVAWVAAARASTWYLAHDLAILCTPLAVMAGLAGWQSRSGFFLGLATLARLTVAFGTPFVFLSVRGGSLRRLLATAAGLAPPILFLLAYNLASSGQLMQPGYEDLYRTEEAPIAALYHAEWAIVDPRYIPQNLAIMLLEPPSIKEQCAIAPVLRDAPARRPDPRARPTQNESAAHQPGMASRHPRPLAPALRSRHRLCRRDRRHRARRPHALQPGLGPVRLPFQQRLGAVRARPRDPRDRAPRAALVGRRTGCRLVPGEPVGCRLGGDVRLLGPYRRRRMTHSAHGPRCGALLLLPGP